MFPKKIIDLKTEAINQLFPINCVNCGQEDPPAGGWLCLNCQKKILQVKSQICPACEKISENGRYCAKCRKGKSLKGIITAVYFKEGPVREMIHHFKYNSVTELAKPLGDLMAEALIKSSQFSIPSSQLKQPKLETGNWKLKTIVTYVPLFFIRQARRGYNQSELLAREVGETTGLPVKSLLFKWRSTKRQVGLKKENRQQNLAGAFLVLPWVKREIKGKNIIIIDDICTTGTTLNECARVLKKSGAKEVWGLVVARG